MTIQTLFENTDFVVVLKPAGTLTVPDRGVTGQERRVLGRELQTERGAQIFPVHRLDFVAEGLVLFAKTPVAHTQANLWFESRAIHKTYRAWTQAQSFAHIPAEVSNPRHPITLHAGQRFEWRCRIKRGKRRAFESPHGDPAITLATFLGKHPQRGVLQWDLEPVTGRPHQLRFELSRHGFPIIGDALYGSTVTTEPDRIALRAWRLDFSAIPLAERFGLPDHIQIDAEPENFLLTRE